MSFSSRDNMAIEEPDIIQWPLTVGLSTLAAAVLGFLAFIAYTPAVHESSPAFTSYTSPFIGSFELERILGKLSVFLPCYTMKSVLTFNPGIFGRGPPTSLRRGTSVSGWVVDTSLA